MHTKILAQTNSVIELSSKRSHKNKILIIKNFAGTFYEEISEIVHKSTGYRGFKDSKNYILFCSPYINIRRISIMEH